MATQDFTQTRADNIVSALLGSNLDAFVDAVAFASGVTPTAAALGELNMPADLSIDAASFSASSSESGSVLASSAGVSHRLNLVVSAGQWKLDSTGSGPNIVQARQS